MPVRSFSSPVLKWPKAEEVHRALRDWARLESHNRPELLRVGYIGSYARGRWGVGSDLDVVLILEHSPRPWIERGRDWDLSSLPVPTDVLIYTASEFERKAAETNRFSRELAEAVWVWQRT